MSEATSRLVFRDDGGRTARRLVVTLWPDGRALVAAWAGFAFNPVQLSAEDVARLLEALKGQR